MMIIEQKEMCICITRASGSDTKTLKRDVHMMMG